MTREWSKGGSSVSYAEDQRVRFPHPLPIFLGYILKLMTFQEKCLLDIESLKLAARHYEIINGRPSQELTDRIKRAEELSREKYDAVGIFFGRIIAFFLVVWFVQITLGAIFGVSVGYWALFIGLIVFNILTSSIANKLNKYRSPSYLTED